MKPNASPTRRNRTPAESLAELVRIATQRGMVLLTGEWHGQRFDYRFRCPAGHEFTRAGDVALRGTVSCLQCVDDAVQRDFRARLEARGFVCREGRYLGQTVRQHFTCSAGHEWITEARKVLAGHGCPSCAVAARAVQMTDPDGLARLRQAAAVHGGQCLADAYSGVRAPYRWECAAGHQWTAEGAKIVEGQWCPRCAVQHRAETRRKPERLAELHAWAVSHGGVCLDETYRGLAARYRFRCAKGHEWSAIGNLVYSKPTWCRRCANEARRLSIERMREVARERGGRCLSKTYVDSRHKLEWECHLGHVWSALPGNVIYRGAWCPYCFRLRVTKNEARRRRYDLAGTGAGYSQDIRDTQTSKSVRAWPGVSEDVPR